MNLLKVTGAAVLTGGIALGGITLYNGTGTLQVAKETIAEYASNLNIFQENETKLVAAISELKAQRNELLAQLEVYKSEENADKTQIAELEAEVQALTDEIKKLENEVLTANENGETLASRIVALELELEKANSEAAELQQVIDANQTSAAPMSAEEIASITDVGSVPVEVEPEEKYIEFIYSKNSNGGKALRINETLSFKFMSPTFYLTYTGSGKIKYQVAGTDTWVEKSMGEFEIKGLSTNANQLVIVELPDGSKYRVTITE